MALCDPGAGCWSGGTERDREGDRQVAEGLFQALIDRDLDGFHGRFHEDSVIEFPQSGERIVGGERRREAYRSFPGRPSVRRILTGGNLAVVEASVDYGDGVDWQAVFILELREARVAKLTAYWGKPFAPAESPGSIRRAPRWVGSRLRRSDAPSNARRARPAMSAAQSSAVRPATAFRGGCDVRHGRAPNPEPDTREV